MENTQSTRAGYILLSGFAVLLGCYFAASYIAHGRSLKIEESMFTPHDDLLAIDGRHNGNKAAVGKFGLIFLTKDGGKTWERRPSGTSKALSDVSFADRQHGYVVGSGGTLLATDDGGATWRAQNSGTEDQLLGVQALSPQQAFTVGAFGTLLSTSDGGRTWSKHELNWDVLIERIVKEGGYLEPNLNAVYFSSSEFGWIVGEFGLVLHTKDGGKTWVSQRYGSDLPQLYAVHFQDDRTGWAIGQAGSFIETKDGGRGWSSVKMDVTRDLYDISLEGERGVIVGDGVVFTSSDGGSNWQSAGAVEDEWLSGVVLKSSEAIAVGRAGKTQLLPMDAAASETGREAR